METIINFFVSLFCGKPLEDEFNVGNIVETDEIKKDEVIELEVKPDVKVDVEPKIEPAVVKTEIKPKYTFSRISKRNLNQCHPDLKLIMEKVIEIYDISIICGYRGKDNQNDAFESGASTLKFPKSKHNRKPSLAVDVTPSPLDWDDIEEFKKMVEIIREVAKDLDIKIRCGADFSFKDYPHIELV